MLGEVRLEDLRAGRITNGAMAFVDHQEADHGQAHLGAVQSAKEASVREHQDLKTLVVF